MAPNVALQRTLSASPLRGLSVGTSGRALQRTIHGVCRQFAIAALLFPSGYFFTLPLAQAPALELDHIYIVVQPPPSEAAEALRGIGLVVDTAISRHEGLGTASMSVFFRNAYLELLWVDSTISVDSAHRGDLAEYRRAANWRDSGASPFGFGLHFLTGTSEDLAFPVRRDPAPHLGPNTYYLLLRQPDEVLAADFFIMPPSAAVTTWLSRYQGRRPDLFAHKLGAGRITRVVLHGPPANRPRAAVLAPRPISFEADASQYLVLEFDGGLEHGRWDLRPTLPLVLCR